MAAFNRAVEQYAQGFAVKYRDRAAVMYNAWKRACEDFPECELDRGRRVWRKKLCTMAGCTSDVRKNSVRNRLDEHRSKLAVDLIKRRVEVRRRLAQMKETRNDDLKWLQQMQKLEGRIKKQEELLQAKIESQKKRTERYEKTTAVQEEREKIKNEDLEIKLAAKREEEKADQEEEDQINAIEIEDGDFDLIRDSRWVYQNINQLRIKHDGDKNPRINMQVLATAPSSGAVWLAKFAVHNEEAFVARFVSKLFAMEEHAEKERLKNIQPEKTQEEEVEELDPDLDGLDQYIKKG